MSHQIVICNQRFSVSDDSRTHSPSICSIHPYDETEYHWARRHPASRIWEIFLNGKRVDSMPTAATEVGVAKRLVQLDQQKKLKPRICRD